MNEHENSELYASFSIKLVSLPTFRQALLNLCQTRFYSLTAIDFHKLGLVTFLAHLFVLKVATERIIHFVIQSLLNVVGNDCNLQCVSQLFKIAGHVIDRPEAREFMRAYRKRLDLMKDFTKSIHLKAEIQEIIAKCKYGWHDKRGWRVGSLRGARNMMAQKGWWVPDKGIIIWYIAELTPSVSVGSVSFVLLLDLPLFAGPLDFTYNGRNFASILMDVYLKTLLARFMAKKN